MLQSLNAPLDIHDDIIQETYLKTIVNIDLDKYRECGQFEAWFKRIAKYSYFNYNRFKEKEDNPYPVIELHIPPKMGNKDIITYLMSKVKTLTKSEKEVVQLHFLEGLNYEEISTFINKSREAIKVTMFRAKKKFRSWVKKNEYFWALIHDD